MRNLRVQAVLLAFIVLFGSCATTYKPVYPSRVNYTTNNLEGGIAFSYKYDVLRENGNKKYAKKEVSKGLKIVAVRISNFTDRTINVSNDLTFYLGNTPIIPVDPLLAKNTLRQIVPSYLPYLLLTLLRLDVTAGSSFNSYPIGLVLGPGLTIGNMAVAASANKNFQTELNDQSLFNKDIPKGETVYGLIGIRDVGYSPISLKLKN
jgi:hypothetical protein